MLKDILLDFTHVYPIEEIKEKTDIECIDCSTLPQTNLLCSLQSEQAIKKILAMYPLSGIHFLDSGNYHYITKFMLDRITYPFSLILIDNHSDMQESSFDDHISCGNWALDVLKKNPYLQHLLLIGPKQIHFNNVYENKLIYTQNIHEAFDQLSIDIPIYISIDKDILSSKYAITNWNQGDMTLEQLKMILHDIIRYYQIIGIDICGNQSSNLPFLEYQTACYINQRSDQELYYYLKQNTLFKNPMDIVQ